MDLPASTVLQYSQNLNRHFEYPHALMAVQDAGIGASQYGG